MVDLITRAATPADADTIERLAVDNHMFEPHELGDFDEMLAGFRSNADWLAAKRQAYSPALKARYVAQHAEIIDAIRWRSPRAARAAMIKHLEEVRRALLES